MSTAPLHKALAAAVTPLRAGALDADELLAHFEAAAAACAPLPGLTETEREGVERFVREWQL